MLSASEALITAMEKAFEDYEVTDPDILEAAETAVKTLQLKGFDVEIKYVYTTESVHLDLPDEGYFLPRPYSDEIIVVNGEEFPVYLMAWTALERLRSRAETAEWYERMLCAA